MEIPTFLMFFMALLLIVVVPALMVVVMFWRAVQTEGLLDEEANDFKDHRPHDLDDK